MRGSLAEGFRLRVLTFNSHQPYVHLLASALPWSLGVVTPRTPAGKVKGWNPSVRPLPGNAALHSSVPDALRSGPWDWVLAHNVSDLLDASCVAAPKALLVHGTLSGRIVQERSRVDRDAYLEQVRTLLQASGCAVVYISELKRRDWGIPGAVLEPGVDPESYGGYRGDLPSVLQVANHIRGRGAMLGWRVYEEVCRGVSGTIVGNNPGMPASVVPASWEELKEAYRAHRVYLYTAVHPYEDGYNLALLEAMSTGMPVATLSHPTSPITDGVDGVTAASAGELREKVLNLIRDRGACMEMGAAARRTVRARFSWDRFRAAWEQLGGVLAGRKDPGLRRGAKGEA